MSAAKNFLTDLNKEYLAIHRKKEDLFWSTYMGTSDDHAGSAAAETAWTQFISDPKRLNTVREHIANEKKQPESTEREQTLTGLQGWQALFQANVLETEQSQQLKEGLIKAESALFEKRQAYTMTYQDNAGQHHEGSTPVLSANIGSNADETIRKTSLEALLGLEHWVLTNGFIELIKLRNEFAHCLGYNSFFDYTVEKTEQMSTKQLFIILDDFQQRTRERNLNSIVQLAATHGDQALTGHNFKYTYSGDSTRLLDPYVSFDQSLSQWVKSFSRLRIDYSEAELTLDLLNRKGKYANGFCHGPVPSFYNDGEWVAAKVNFTSLAEPGQIGSGYNALNTLFHEGGHAAHFANIKMNSPCFSQEFAPSSMAFAETQSMFLDSLIADGDWLKTYAKNSAGEVIPDQIVHQLITEKQPFRAYEERSILVMPYFERALYELSDDELTVENIIALARSTEKQILGLDLSPRPLLAIPHLLSDQSACTYQGYLLANMAVYQTRAYFVGKYGYLTDNPEIGPALAEHYWYPGNSISHDDSIHSLTGEGFNAKYLADECNLSVDELWQREQLSIESAKNRTASDVQPLNASIKIVDGDKLLASNEISNKQMCSDFSQYVKKAANQ